MTVANAAASPQEPAAVVSKAHLVTTARPLPPPPPQPVVSRHRPEPAEYDPLSRMLACRMRRIAARGPADAAGPHGCSPAQRSRFTTPSPAHTSATAAPLSSHRCPHRHRQSMHPPPGPTPRCDVGTRAGDSAGSASELPRAHRFHARAAAVSARHATAQARQAARNRARPLAGRAARRACSPRMPGNCARR